MTPHDLVILLNVIRLVILIAALVGVVVYKHVPRGVTICVVTLLLILNLVGLSIAYFLVNLA